MKDNYLVQAWLVLCLALVFGAGLAGLDASLADKITANKLNETIGQIPSLVDGAVGGKPEVIAGRTVYRASDADGKHVGWVIPAAGPGFADAIEVLIGLDAKCETITGLYVLAQKETPGLGNKIIDESWRGQFTGKGAASPLAIKKATPLGEDEILSITGATISSESVTKIVNDTIRELRDQLAGERITKPQTKTEENGK